MPPKNATTGASRRGGPQFKPPRPVKAPAQPSTTTTKRAPATSKKASAPTSRAKVRPEPTVILSSGDERDEFDDDIDMDSDDLMEDAPTRPTDTRPSAAPALTPSPIPAPLLARLLYENFENEHTQIQKGAMNLVGKYVDIFVREAFARAKHERELAVKGGGISDGFLQVEDLEKLAPQLVLDF